MRNKLKANSVIWFDPAENGTFKHYLKITDCIGEGGTGIVYTGIDDNGIVWVIKESFPNTENSVLNTVHVYRRGDGNISAYADNDYYDLNTEINRILENENDVALILQNDLTNKIMNMPFYNGILKGAAIQCPGQSFPVICNQMFSRMQYIKGVTADKADFSDTLDRLRVIEDILKAIAKIHQADFILGDIKPLNIMIADGGNGRCFVLDYGSAVKTDTNGVANIDPLTYPRSSGYIGPELYDMADGHAYLTKAYDVYSLGALLMDLLMPQRTKTIREIQYRQRMEFHYRFLYEDLEAYGAFSRLSIMQELPVSPALADELSRILQKCLADDREERYQDAGELLEDYSRFLNNYQYKTLKPQNYNYHLFWQASYDYLGERLNDMISGIISKMNEQKMFGKRKPEWWRLEQISGYDRNNNCYPDAGSIRELLQQECVYMYAPKGSGKTIKACQIMQRCLWEMPVLYVDASMWSNEEESCFDLSEEVILSQSLWKPLGYLPDDFSKGLKNSQNPFLIVIDNINNITSAHKESVLRSIVNLQSEFRSALILLIGLNETIGNDTLDISFRKIRIESLEGEENALLRTPFFHMLYQKMKYRDPEFSLNTDSEVELLDIYMDSLGKDYYKYEKLLLELAVIATNSPSAPHIYEGFLINIAGKDFSQAEHDRMIDTLTDQLGLLVQVQEETLSATEVELIHTLYGNSNSRVFEFTHDIYRDYFTARRFSQSIETSVLNNSIKPLSAIREMNSNVVRMLLTMLGEQKLDYFHMLLSDTDDQDMQCMEMIKSFVDYYWFCENHTVNKWAELGMQKKVLFSMAVTATDLMMKISSGDCSELMEAADLCRQAIGMGMGLISRQGIMDNVWAREYLGMLILHDALKDNHYNCYLDTENFRGFIVPETMESLYRHNYYRMESLIGRIPGLTINDGLKLYYGDNPPEELLSILCDPSDKSALMETHSHAAYENMDEIRVKMMFWNIIKDTERDYMTIYFEEWDSELEFLAAVKYEGKIYYVTATCENMSHDGTEEIIILKEMKPKIMEYIWKTLTGNGIMDKFDEHIPLKAEKNKRIRNAVFDIFMNEYGGNEVYEIIE